MIEENTKKTRKLNAGFFFLSLGVVITLIASVASALSLFFKVIEQALPDALNPVSAYSYVYNDIRVSLAILIIALPALFIINHFWQKFLRQGLNQFESVFLKWGTYFILFLASLTILIDLITLVNNFLAGEITSQFIYKVLVTAAVASIALLYYHLNLKMFERGDLQKRKYPNPKTGLSIVTVVLFFCVIIFTFNTIGTPKEQRARRLDQQRIMDLQNIEATVLNYYQAEEALPENLEEAFKTSYAIPKDPETNLNKNYSYQKVDTSTFKLCADFSSTLTEDLNVNIPTGIYLNVASTSKQIILNDYSWKHPAGDYCFAREIMIK